MAAAGRWIPGAMKPSACELYRSLLRRAVGGRSAFVAVLASLAVGAVAGAVAARCLLAGLGTRPSTGLVAWLLVNFPQTSLYGLGVHAAGQVVAAGGDDARTGWTTQYLAAGGTRDRYVLALAAASTTAAALFYLLATSAWLAVGTAFGRPVSLLGASTAFVPVAMLWLATPAAFAAAAIALTARTGRAVALMLAVVALPWLVLAALRPAPEVGAPAWLVWTTALAPPYPVSAGASACLYSTGYAALLLGIAWLAAPQRLLRL